MYTAPNGMVFKDYWAAMEFNRKEIKKEFDSLFSEYKFICPVCKKQCIKSSIRDIYICVSCNKAFSMEEEDESENTNQTR